MMGWNETPAMRALIAIALSVSLLAAAPKAGAQSWPAKPLKLVVPLPPGGGGDMVGRLAADELGKRLGQSVVVENRAGAGSIIGTEVVAKSAPDGYTLLMATDFHAINGAFGGLPYDSVKDFSPVSRLIELQIIMLANPKAGLKTVADIVAAAKSRPGRVTAGTPGTSSPHYLAFKLLQQSGGIELLEVPFQGSGPATTALLGGQVDLIFAGVGAGMQLAKSGQAVAIAVSSLKRDPVAPDVPTIAESGFPGFSILSWMAVLAPAGTPAPVVMRLNNELARILRDPPVVDKLAKAGFTSAPSTPEEMSLVIRNDIEKLRKIIVTAGAKPDGR